MKFLKLHQNGIEILVNMCAVSAACRNRESGKSILYLNFLGSDGRQVKDFVDESLNEIYEKVKGNENVRD